MKLKHFLCLALAFALFAQNTFSQTEEKFDFYTRGE